MHMVYTGCPIYYVTEHCTSHPVHLTDWLLIHTHIHTHTYIYVKQMHDGYKYSMTKIYYKASR